MAGGHLKPNLWKQQKHKHEVRQLLNPQFPTNPQVRQIGLTTHSNLQPPTREVTQPASRQSGRPSQLYVWSCPSIQNFFVSLHM